MSTVSATGPRDSLGAVGRVTWVGLVRGEAVKLRSQRAVVLCILGTGVLIAVIGIIGGYGFAGELRAGRPVDDDTFRALPSMGLAFAQLLLGSAAVLVVTSEWGSGAIRVLVAAVQRRQALYAAKALVMAVAGFAVTVLGGAVVAIGAAPALRPVDRAGLLSGTDTLEYLAVMGLVGGAICLMGVGLGAVARHSTGGITTLIGLLVVVPIVVALVPSQGARTLGDYLPMNAAGYVLSPGAPVEGLSHGAATLVLAAWTLGLLALGGVRMTRDI